MRTWRQFARCGRTQFRRRKTSRWAHKDEAKKQAKKRYFENIETELGKKDELERRIRDLEAKENELINVLKDTNNLELLAMEDLKKILSGEQFNGLLDNLPAMNASVRSKK